MKIVQLITRMDVLGGAQIHVFDLAIALQKKGHEVTVLSYGTSHLTKKLEKGGITYRQIEDLSVPISPYKDIRALLHIRKELKRIQPDLIAIHSSKAGIVGRLAGYSLNIPTIFTAHSWSFAGVESKLKRKFYISLEKIIAKCTKGVITVSQFDYEAALLHDIINPEKIQVIHNGLHDITYKKRSTETETLQLLMVARFAKPKDHQLLLDALDDLRAEPFHLTLVGGGPLLRDVKNYATSLQLQDKVTFTGEIMDVEQYYRQAQICLLISDSEGLPLTIVEAMRAGNAVIGSNVGGMKELIEHGENGILVSKGNKQALVNALKQILHDKALREKFAYTCREKYEKQFQFSKMFQETEKFYMEITKEDMRGEEAI